MTRKKRYSSEEKTMILRELLENQHSIGELAEKYGIHPNAIYQWKKKMFETAPSKLSKQNKQTEKKQFQLINRIAELEATLAIRESLIAELVADNIYLKKKTAGGILINNGLNRR